VKFFDTDEDAIIKVLSLFRSLRVFGEFKEHKKCIISNKNPKGKLCSFCLMWSIVFKSKISKGRQVIKPVEILCIIPMEIISEPTHKIVNVFLENISKCVPEFKELVATKWICSECKVCHDLTDKYCIHLDQETKSTHIENLIEMKTCVLRNNHRCKSQQGDFKFT
jgi:hypothetical protein